MNEIIPQNYNNSTHTKMCFYFDRFDQGTNPIPSPTALHCLNKGFLVTYLLKGDFTTKKAARYYSDAVSRFVLTFECEYKDVSPTNDPDFFNPYLVYDLKDITKELNSLKARFKTSEFSNKFEDEVFWMLKIYVEQRLRNGFLITQKELEAFLLSEFGNKERSTLRAKAKSVYNWYAKRNFQPTGRVHEMSRSENMKRVRKEQAEQMKAKVIGAVESFRFLNEKITAKNVAEYLKCSRTTATKYLKELGYLNSQA